MPLGPGGDFDNDGFSRWSSAGQKEEERTWKVTFKNTIKTELARFVLRNNKNHV